MKIASVIALASITLLASQCASAGSGSQDLTFGQNGEAITTFDAGGTHFDLSRALVAGPGGVTYQVGSISIDYPLNPYVGEAIGIIRYTHKGKPDLSYGSAGKVLHSDPNIQILSAYSADIDSSGRLVTTGQAYGGVLGENSLVSVCRFTTEGDPDLAFGDISSPGCKYIKWDHDVGPVALKIDAHGDIFLGVNSYNTYYATVMKLDADGQFVPSFNGGIGNVLAGKSYIWDMALTPEGDVVVAGFSRVSLDEWQGMVAKYNGKTGEMAGFGNNGIVDFNPLAGIGKTLFKAVSIASDGSILVGGQNEETSRDSLIVRFAESGKIDESFGDIGMRVVAVSDDDYTNVYNIDDVLVGNGNDIYVGMEHLRNIYLADPDANPPQVLSSFVFKLKGAGEADDSYGNEGMAFASFTKPQEMAEVRLVMQGERVLLGTQTYAGPWGQDMDPDFALVRFDHGIKKSAFKITPNFGPNGSLKPSLPVFAAHSHSREFQVVPKPGYEVDIVSGCAGALFGSVYVTGPAVDDCSVTATFKKL